MSKDYYKILGIAEFETAENIKIAYRKLARKWHPDIAGNSKDVLEKFREINEAYEILSNKIKKAEYDRARMFYKYAEEGAFQNQNSQKNTTNPQSKKESFCFNWEEFLHKKNRETSFKKNVKHEPISGKDIHTDIEISITEAICGTVKSINMLQTTVCPYCNGRKFVNGGTCLHCKGKGELTNYKKFTVSIPSGIKNKSKIRLAGEGAHGLNGGKNGNLYITVHIQESKEYKTEGLNILKTVPITPSEAVLGTTIKICSINGILSVKINPKTQNGQKIRLSGCGLMQNEKFGDMIITVEIRIPNNLTKEELELYKKLDKISTSNIRETF